MSSYTRKNSLRLQGYDYAQAGAYFVTILAHQRRQLFGSITDGIMSLSKLGECVCLCWQRIPQHFPAVELDVSVVMPNHLHGIVVLHNVQEQAPSLSAVVNSFKGAVTRLARREDVGLDLDMSIWHRSFHDHIIRNEADLNRIREYVMFNPARWTADTFYAVE